ncbi:PDZ domain-containing protein [Nocardioides marmoriginsengisoli]|uniref:PDZ domain-containing protein n=1 Tax=Nocardioides marmoriginsengisoli TaxID=661483 RepID=A0A3N0CQ10_9ACTN|nr:site-2 protease family protein [Nocardioides marmoriginsengisoli]RNL65106.1 PDZ domain-containing protein [Nocardioides marmoriginsengisoli]
MTVLLYVLGVLVIVVGLAISIALHECGHMLPAKRFGVRVPQFFVGFGKTLWSTKRGDTEYGVKAFPLGGFVKLVGMLPPSDPSTPAKDSTFGRLISDARAAEAELVRPGDEHRMFYRLPWWKKVIVMAGGPTVNLVIAFFLFGAVFWFHGVSETTTKVATIPDCVVAVLPDKPAPKCTTSDPVAPSKLAGMKVGDEIVGFNGTRITSYDQLQKLIRATPEQKVAIDVIRDGERLTLTATTLLNTVPTSGDSTKTVDVGYLGISPLAENVSKGPIFTLQQMGDYTGQTVQALGQLPQKLWGVAKAVVGQQDRDPESPQSVLGVSRFAGEVTSDDRLDAGTRVTLLVSILASVNLFVGMFNFVPLLPLDGGHIAGALYEAVRRGFARLFGRRDPGHFDVAKLLPVTYVVAGLLLLMTALLVVADLIVPVNTGL